MEKGEILDENLIFKSMVNQMVLKPRLGSIVEGPVIDIQKSSIFVDLSPFGTGIICGNEFINAKDIARKINIGDIIKAKISEVENENGYVELSLKEARQALIWAEAEKAIKEKTVMNLEIKNANRGGLILEWQNIPGFLPTSQLKESHYPRIEDSDKEKIQKELKKLVGQKIPVIIISTLPKENKLIFSEKDSTNADKEKIISKYNLGDEVEANIVGIVDFGIFLKLDENLEGLVHISELDWGLIDDPRTLFKIGDKIKARIIEIKDGKISLSIKTLKENPWTEFEGKLKKGSIVSGVIIKYNKFGALASIKDGVAGLVHFSSFGSEEKLRERLELGKTYNFQINIFDPKTQKMTLLYTEESEAKNSTQESA